MIKVKVFLSASMKMIWAVGEFDSEDNKLKPKRGSDINMIVGYNITLCTADSGQPVVKGTLRRGSRGYYLENTQKL